MPELRKDPITGRSVIIAGERAKRPRQLGKTSDTEDIDPCPLCAGNETMTLPEVMAVRGENTPANSTGWSVRVVPNKYPALVDSDEKSLLPDPTFESHPALGVHEVIVESPEHLTSMGILGVEQITQILRVYRGRMVDLQKDPRWRYMLLYKNHGERAGATFEHIHSQLIALSTVPELAAREINGAKRYHQSTGGCIYCAMIERELGQRERLVSILEVFVALCPLAPSFAYETWIGPTHHAVAFEQTSDRDISSLAHILLQLIAKLNRALDNPPFNYLIQSLPGQESNAIFYHWRMEILPQIAGAAGFEWGTGMHLNSVTPENAARLLRDATV